MTNALLAPGFLNQALTYGFRIGHDQIPGRPDIEALLYEDSAQRLIDPCSLARSLETLRGRPAVPPVASLFVASDFRRFLHAPLPPNDQKLSSPKDSDPPPAGTALQIAGSTIEKPHQTIDQNEETERALWKNVSTACSALESEREKALIELKALTSQAGQHQLLKMAAWSEKRAHDCQNAIEETYINSRVLPHIAPLLSPRNLHRLADRMLARLGRFQRFWHGSYHVGVALKCLRSVFPFLSESKHRQAVRKLVGLLSPREWYLRGLVLEILQERRDFISPKEFRAAAFKIAAVILNHKKSSRGGDDWDLKEAATNLAQLMPLLSMHDRRKIIARILRDAAFGFDLPRFLPLLEDRLEPIIEIEKRWRQGEYPLQETLEAAVAALTVPDRLALLERLIAPGGFQGLHAQTVALILNQVPAADFISFVKGKNSRQWERLFKHYSADQLGPFR